jgi:hypothetical protein
MREGQGKVKKRMEMISLNQEKDIDLIITQKLISSDYSK